MPRGSEYLVVDASAATFEPAIWVDMIYTLNSLNATFTN